MRIENRQTDNVANSSGSSGGVRSVNQENRIPNCNADNTCSDSVQLSGARNLIVLAHNLLAVGRQAKLDTLTTQVQQGKYQVDSDQVSQALIASYA